MTTVAFLLLLTVVGVVNRIWSMEVIPERANVGKVNEKFVTDVKFYVRRYNRRSAYYINLELTPIRTLDNNVSVQFVFYEFLHNEYKRSFVQFEYKFCDLIYKSIYIGAAFRASGAACPMLPRPWKMNNMTVPTKNFPNVFPLEKCRVDIRYETIPEKEHIADLQLYLFIKQDIVGK